MYWRLLSGDLEVAKSIVLSQKPAITTTMSSLPPALLEQLLSELSTLASVYHKPPESFVGKGRFGADEIQRAAIREQRQEAAENPIAASVAAVTGSGSGAPSSQNNVENLLDIDFDGAAPASAEQNSNVNTPDRVASPAGGAAGNNMADMMGLFDAPAPAPAPQAQQQPAGNPSGLGDMMNGFADLNFGATSSNQPLPAGMQLHGQSQPNASGGEQKKTNDDLLGLF